MPGLGRRTFIATEVLTAANVNGYLMDQSVMVFAGTAARSSAIGTAVSEGMVSYLSDSNALQFYDGAAWQPVDTSGGTGNAIINGDFGINQRNFTTSTSADVFVADRILATHSSGSNSSTLSSFSPGAAPVAGYEGSRFGTFTSSGQNTSTGLLVIWTRVEDVRSFAAQTVTFSFWAKAASGTPRIAPTLYQNFGFGGSSTVTTTMSQVTLSTSWARYSVSVTLPSISGKTIGTGSYLQATLWLSGSTSVNADTGSLPTQNNTFDIWGLQLEAGSTATPFKRNANSIEGELAACQRYYYQHLMGNNVSCGLGTMTSNVDLVGYIQFPTTMRTAPSLVSTTGTDFYVFERAGSLDYFNSFIISGRATNTSAGLINSTQVSGTGGQAGFIFTNNASAAIGFNSEL
jgi:hypothetical protein